MVRPVSLHLNRESFQIQVEAISVYLPFTSGRLKGVQSLNSFTLIMRLLKVNIQEKDYLRPTGKPVMCLV